MKALVVVPSQPGILLVERTDPVITRADEVTLRVLRVGICGTDREEVEGGRAEAPPGQSDLVIGHEMFGQVLAVGGDVTRVRVGDYAVFTVRRGCGKCTNCLMSRHDMCRTGAYNERGIRGLDGFQSEFVVDREQHIVRVPHELEPVGVLLEPLSVAEKAIDVAVGVQRSRLPDFQSTPNWLYGKRCLVAGLGPIGLLAAMALRLRGAEVYGLDRVEPSSPRPAWLTAIGGIYVDSRKTSLRSLDDSIGEMDLLFDATGVPAVELDLLDALAEGGVYVLTGIPAGDRSVEIPAAAIIRKLVLNNQAMLGSVNAARDHFQMAADDLSAAQGRWGDLIVRLITHRFPVAGFAAAFQSHTSDEIKAVIEWSDT